MQQKVISPVNFAEHLALLLKERGLNQLQFAAAVQVSQATVVKWLKGSVPKADALNRAANFFGIHPDYLFNPSRYSDPFKIAKEAAAKISGSDEEKQMEFERVVKIETAKLKARQQSIGEGMQASERITQGYDDIDWKKRALVAERKLERIRVMLAESANED